MKYYWYVKLDGKVATCFWAISKKNDFEKNRQLLQKLYIFASEMYFLTIGVDCRMGQRSYWHWFDVNKDMRKRTIFAFLFSDLDTFDHKSALPVTRVQGHVFTTAKFSSFSYNSWSVGTSSLLACTTRSKDHRYEKLGVRRASSPEAGRGGGWPLKTFIWVWHAIVLLCCNVTMGGVLSKILLLRDP